MIFFFFFFQAEDGIRYPLVTGVQTCALPILLEAVVSCAPPSPAPPDVPDGLTQREVEVLTEIGAGLSNAEIAAKFRISGATVKSHINHLLAKTGARDRAQ